MECIELGYITFCTNVPKDYYPSDLEAAAVSLKIREDFEDLLREAGLADEIVVLRVEYELGCILTTISIGIIVGGLYKFVKDYKKIRPNIIQLFNDVAKLQKTLFETPAPQTTCIYDQNLPTAEQILNLLKLCEQGKVPAAEPEPSQQVHKATPAKRVRKPAAN